MILTALVIGSIGAVIGFLFGRALREEEKEIARRDGYGIGVRAEAQAARARRARLRRERDARRAQARLHRVTRKVMNAIRGSSAPTTTLAQ